MAWKRKSLKFAKPEAPQTPSEQINVKIAQALKTGEKQITVQLHPQEMGSVKVTIDIAANGKTSISFTALVNITRCFIKYTQHWN